MIRQEEVLARIFAAVPTFEESPEYQFMSEYYTGDDGETLYYAIVPQLVRHIVRLRLGGETNSIRVLFNTVEEMVRDGDDFVRELAIVGFLEDLQNANLHIEGSAPERFVPFLRPWSRWWWEEVALFWEGRASRIGGSGRPRPDGMPDPMATA